MLPVAYIFVNDVIGIPLGMAYNVMYTTLLVAYTPEFCALNDQMCRFYPQIWVFSD